MAKAQSSDMGSVYPARLSCTNKRAIEEMCLCRGSITTGQRTLQFIITDVPNPGAEWVGKIIVAFGSTTWELRAFSPPLVHAEIIYPVPPPLQLGPSIMSLKTVDAVTRNTTESHHIRVPTLRTLTGSFDLSSSCGHVESGRLNQGPISYLQGR
ncbi:hypothetical protein P280DRAFT_71342 [Massarina eburnea CBS 473.64]|uniref:Uncharacterized protein n=1 Tax=Massarina eburnea CBS 473.64 TaxID=1395130 RepID=A0A6A6RSL9_9PLEO|nr:hypothetical protein P280DRAFT_71342 [Massarina eburnea CBS 473.64]